MRILLVLTAAILPAIACECVSQTICDVLRQPTLFIGEVIDGGITSIQEDPWHSIATLARFKVLANFRGLPAGSKTIDVELIASAGMCAPIPYHLGREYLMMPVKRGGRFL